ncbi:MAG: hypothetical protein AAGE93_04230 [Bacteroidota bacterium]
MIQIKPYLPQPTGLPETLQNVLVEDLIFTGIYTLIRLRNNATQAVYYHTLPTGHAAQFPVTFSADGKEKYYPAAAEVWMATPLINSVLRKLTIYPPIEKTVLQSYSEVVLLNCLDSCYGHVLYKIFNAQRHLDNNFGIGLILIIPHSHKWLVPSGVAEIWSVDVPLNQLSSWVSSLDDFVKNELSRFQQVYLSLAIMELDLATVSIERFTGIKPPLPSHWQETPKKVTFICREDRFWLSNILDQLLYLLARKLRWDQRFKLYFARKQNWKFAQVAQWLKQQDASITFTAVGLGVSGSLGDLIDDQRLEKITSDETEYEWCRLYTRSHVVIGVHGSNMLLPSAFAAGFVNLLPDFKEPHKGEDVFPPSGTAKATLERYFPTSISPTEVAKQALDMLKIITERYAD